MRNCALQWRHGKKEVSHGFQQDAETGKPLRGRGQNKERVMMRPVIILVILLVISLPAY
ncbi:type I toxin-antitoxin system Ibs family toxin [Citrobacter farmeri]